MTKHRVLFLDDRSKRLHAALKKYKDDDLTLVCTVKECKKMIAEKTWDIISLDCDLGFEEYVNTDEENTGMEVVRWLETDFRFAFHHGMAQWLPRPDGTPANTSFIIHSSNYVSGTVMAERLKRAGYSAKYERFVYD